MPNWHPWARAVDEAIDQMKAEAYEKGQAAMTPPDENWTVLIDEMERKIAELERANGQLTKALRSQMRDDGHLVNCLARKLMHGFAIEDEPGCVMAREALRISQGDSNSK